MKINFLLTAVGGIFATAERKRFALAPHSQSKWISPDNVNEVHKPITFRQKEKGKAIFRRIDYLTVGTLNGAILKDEDLDESNPDLVQFIKDTATMIKESYTDVFCIQNLSTRTVKRILKEVGYEYELSYTESLFDNSTAIISYTKTVESTVKISQNSFLYSFGSTKDDNKSTEEESSGSNKQEQTTSVEEKLEDAITDGNARDAKIHGNASIEEKLRNAIADGNDSVDINASIEEKANSLDSGKKVLQDENSETSEMGKSSEDEKTDSDEKNKACAYKNKTSRRTSVDSGENYGLIASGERTFINKSKNIINLNSNANADLSAHHMIIEVKSRLDWKRVTLIVVNFESKKKADEKKVEKCKIDAIEKILTTADQLIKPLFNRPTIILGNFDIDLQKVENSNFIEALVPEDAERSAMHQSVFSLSHHRVFKRADPHGHVKFSESEIDENENVELKMTNQLYYNNSICERIYYLDSTNLHKESGADIYLNCFAVTLYLPYMGVAINEIVSDVYYGTSN